MYDMLNYKIKYNSVCVLLSCLLLTACIENDVPYPYREGSITEFQIEGQIGFPEINKANGTVTVEVSDAVDLKQLTIQKMTVTNEAKIVADSSRCVDYKNFPQIGFVALDSLPKTANTRMNFSSPASFLLETYQEYFWKITVNQKIVRTIEISNQVGSPVMDIHNKQVIIYVAKSQRLDKIEVRSMQLGGSAATIKPEPTTVTDFSRPQTFKVTRFGAEETWKVVVLHSEGDVISGGDDFVMAKQIIVTGGIQEGKTPTIEYKEKAASTWVTLSESSVVVKGTTFSATIDGLKAGTTYIYRVSVDGNAGTETECTTAAELTLTNGSFEDWHQVGKVWNPWPLNATSFWDTGNKGATTLGESNTIPTDETSTGTGKAAKLESKFVGVGSIGKFAAGNMFSGAYVRTDGTNGVLSFGRPFISYPTSLKFHYKYTSALINKCNDMDYEYLKNRSDSCVVYIALTDWAEPYEIRTKKSERKLFDINDKHIIAYGEFVSGKSVSEYVEQEIKLKYRYQRVPKYILVVASASKYGDYFTGGDGSTLWLDDFELVYE